MKSWLVQKAKPALSSLHSLTEKMKTFRQIMRESINVGSTIAKIIEKKGKWVYQKTKCFLVGNRFQMSWHLGWVVQKLVNFNLGF